MLLPVACCLFCALAPSASAADGNYVNSWGRLTLWDIDDYSLCSFSAQNTPFNAKWVLTRAVTSADGTVPSVSSGRVSVDANAVFTVNVPALELSANATSMVSTRPYLKIVIEKQGYADSWSEVGSLLINQFYMADPYYSEELKRTVYVTLPQTISIDSGNGGYYRVVLHWQQPFVSRPAGVDVRINSVDMITCSVSRGSMSGDGVWVYHTHQWATSWSYSEEYHWHDCLASICDITDNTRKKDYGPHTFGTGADTSCTVCHSVSLHVHEWSGVWVYQDGYHWQECLNSDGKCGITENSEKGYYGPHTLDGNFTCTSCGYVSPHVHEWSGDWSSNGGYHWHECLNTDGRCTLISYFDKGSSSPHSFDTTTWVCTVCG